MAALFAFFLSRQRAQNKRALEAERERLTAAVGEVEKARGYNLAYVNEARYLAEVRVPAFLEVHARHTPGVAVPGLAQPTFEGSALAGAYQQVLDGIGKSFEVMRHDVGGSARVVVEHLLDEPLVRMTRLSSGILAEIEQHQDPAVIESLMRLDALASTARHAVQRGLILAGAWPGVQRDTSPIGDIIEGARGRVETHTSIKHLYSNTAADVWVHGRIVEPLVVALTELLDNAAKHSARPVDVKVQDAATGYAIVVDDAGIGMNNRQRDRANALMSGESTVDITDLGEGQVGFHIVGALCSRYGFRAEIAGPSAFGGTRVVMLISRDDISTETAAAPPAPGAEPSAARLANPPMQREVTAAVPAPRPRPSPGPVSESERTVSGLPVRQRGPKPPPSTAGPDAAKHVEFDADEAAAGLANFSRAFTDTDEEERK
ncbi:hypothetical protein Pen01_44980 [Phytomonospora endophytica]|nr:hypothetical protein Pen01_44980 [Phytomonospora endophytica]